MSSQIDEQKFMLRGQLASGPVVAVNQKQTVTITGTPEHGTLTLTIPAAMKSFLGISGDTTAGIAFNAAHGDVQSAILALVGATGMGGGARCAVTGGPGPDTPWVVEWKDDLGGFEWGALTTTDSLTGGTDPASAVEITTHGVEATYRGALPGVVLCDEKNGVLYENTGLQAVPVWTKWAGQ